MSLLLLGLVMSAILAGIARGGSAKALARVKLRAEVPILVVFVIQAAARGRLGVSGEVSALSLPVWLVASALVLWMLGLNLRQPGVSLIFSGVALNTLIVLIAGGMPVDAPAAQSNPILNSSGFYVPVEDGKALRFLGDVVPLTLLNSRFLVSIGDLLLFAGLWWFVFRAVQTPMDTDGETGSRRGMPA
jgi:hypothetical protein